MRFWIWFALGLTALGLAAFAAADAPAQKRATPYYASIAAGKAHLRTGPGRNYPINWLYRRADLPIKVIDIYGDWRKIEDPDGTQGWMHVGLLASRRTAIITDGIAALRDAADAAAPINWRAEPGVVGRLSDCEGGWCYFDVKGRGGYVEQTHLWGVDPGEEF
ncbi:SH3 domain-containing protein [Stakelama saccharophila]|uniref:SH3 domain-containing protein n=1 Tax=Stakelama saccharophila TaxID=3075605 RepID=A0ABZ0B745_9SPHN|nr:SH3 domain-containing protein [Stakelama sp. W311]WNO52936.1 SH3 domain-containing protein [Stakelama sp. W311]